MKTLLSLIPLALIVWACASGHALAWVFYLGLLFVWAAPWLLFGWVIYKISGLNHYG